MQQILAIMHGVRLSEGGGQPIIGGDELAQGLFHPEVAGAYAQVVVREQHLGDRDLVGGKTRLPGLHQAALADRGTGLLF